VGQAALAVIVIGLAIRSLAGQWDVFQSQHIEWRLSPRWIVAAAAVVWGSYAVLVEGWRRAVLAMRQRISWVQAARICMVSNLGKYLPGKVWAIAGAAVLAQREGVEPAAAITSALVLQALSLASGLILAAGLAPAALDAVSPAARYGLLALAALALAGLAILAMPGPLRLVRSRLPRALAGLEAVPPGTLLLALGTNFVAWSGYGVAFLCLLRGLTAGGEVSWAQGTAVFSLSYLIGLIAAFAPGGLGPREFAFVLLLSPVLGPKLAVAMAVATRLLLTVTELGAALPFLPGVRRAGSMP
jgi:uncharacterized membrane protein YbhN (UPF0104 family)